MAFAGSWDAWKDNDGRWLQSFAIVTTEANELLACMLRECRSFWSRAITTAGLTAEKQSVCL